MLFDIIMVTNDINFLFHKYGRQLNSLFLSLSRPFAGACITLSLSLLKRIKCCCCAGFWFHTTRPSETSNQMQLTKS